jgi:hypothetical protein
MHRINNVMWKNEDEVKIHTKTDKTTPTRRTSHLNFLTPKVIIY